MVVAEQLVGGSSNSSSGQRALAFAALLWSALLVSNCRSFLPTAATTSSLSSSSFQHHYHRPQSNGIATSRTAAPLHYTNDRTKAAAAAATTSSDVANADTKSSSLSSSSQPQYYSPKKAPPQLPWNNFNSWFPTDRQVLRFREPETNVTVLLIGSMHYNPASIRLVESMIDTLGGENALASVVIESCDIRWNKTQEIMQQKQLKQRQTTQNPGDGGDDSAQTTTTLLLPSNDKDFLGNEMRAAWEVATQYQRPTVLGDQRINITVDALKASLKETASDLLWGGPAGWKRSGDEIAAAWSETIPIASFDTKTKSSSSDDDNNNDDVDTEYLSAVAFFDPRLLISLPVSLVKYPLSFLIKDPVPVGTFFALVAALNIYGSSGGDGSGILLNMNNFDGFSATDLAGWLAAAVKSLVSEPASDHPVTDYIVSLFVAVLETVVFARLLLKPLLADRNAILAKSVLDQCRIYAADADAASEDNANTAVPESTNRWFDRFFALPSKADTTAINSNSNSNSDIVYVPGTDPETMRKLAAVAASNNNSRNDNTNNKGTTSFLLSMFQSNNNGEIEPPTTDNHEKVVVAVLGMAHCNGVMKLLKEQRV